MNQKIGLVEDDDRVRRSFARAIARSTDLTLWFESDSMTGAIEWMRACAPENWPDIWLVDLGLPDGSGLAVIEQAIDLHPDAQVMVVSTFGDEAKVLDSIAAGASGYILKGEGDDEILAHIEDLRRGGTPMSPVIARQVLHRMRVQHTQLSQQQQQTVRDQAPLGDDGLAGRLTEREEAALNLIARGYIYDDVGQQLGMSTNTVRYHVKNIYSKLGVHSKIDAVREARRRKWIEFG
jgi:DNA-binding NarL/FixJ family response regulator